MTVDHGAVVTVDHEDVEIIATQAEQDARLHPKEMWAVGVARCAAAIRFLQAELETARALL